MEFLKNGVVFDDVIGMSAPVHIALIHREVDHVFEVVLRKYLIHLEVILEV